MTPGFYFTKVNFVWPPLVFPVGFGHLYESNEALKE